MELQTQVLLWELVLLHSECRVGGGPEWGHNQVFVFCAKPPVGA